MTGTTRRRPQAGTGRAAAASWPARAGGWLRATRGGLFAVALAVGAGAGLGAVAFRYLIYLFTWLATGHDQFGQQGRVPSGHLPWLGLGFFVVIPVIGGLVYGPLIYRYAREARGHGVPEVMIAVAEGAAGSGRRSPRSRRWPRRSVSGSAARWGGRGRSCRSARRWPPPSGSGSGCRKAG
jgi:H+/Cl- antiporter ClcA